MKLQEEINDDKYFKVNGRKIYHVLKGRGQESRVKKYGRNQGESSAQG